MKASSRHKSHLGLFLLLTLMTCLGSRPSCTDTDIDSIDEVPIDYAPYYDTDTDGISNAVELNDANSYLGLDPDVYNDNPTIAHGQPCNGSLENGLNLVNEGCGYYHYNIDPPGDVDDWGVLHLINMIEGAGRDWYVNYRDTPRVGVGDMSLRYGGTFQPHSCHQNGLNADFRYVRIDGQESSLELSDTTQIQCYDRNSTLVAMAHLQYNGNVTEIILSPYAGIEGGVVVIDWSGKHDNHFHVSIEDPDGTGN